MRKKLLLLPLFLLVSCKSNDVSGTIISSNGEEVKINVDIYKLRYTADDGYTYFATIDYLQGAELQLCRYKGNEDTTIHKKWKFGEYNVIPANDNIEYLYDYGSYAIYRIMDRT